jgi:hypothetical protein
MKTRSENNSKKRDEKIKHIKDMLERQARLDNERENKRIHEES